VIRHIFFDFDGVLCDSLGACSTEYERLRRDRFPALPPLAAEGRLDQVFAGQLKTSLNRWLSLDETATFFDEHSAAMAAYTDLMPFAGVRELLASLPPGSASIVSSAYNEAIRRVISQGNVMPASIAFVKGRDSREPKDVKIRSVLDALGLDAEQAVYVGDLESDYLYCQAVPIRIILVAYGYHSAEHLRRAAPDAFAIVGSVSELTQTLVELLTGEPVST
jgi:phosphoglycolate phosphatase-like HAD superfamily hydrolase